MADPMRARLFGVVQRPAAIENQAVVVVVDVAPELVELSVVPMPTQAILPRKPEWDTRYKELVGRSPSLYRVLDRLDRLTRTKQATVLIRGESGTGKELVAAAIHKHTQTVPIACSTLESTKKRSAIINAHLASTQSTKVRMSIWVSSI